MKFFSKIFYFNPPNIYPENPEQAPSIPDNPEYPRQPR